jgi:PAS domain S-box-containing protein
MGRNSNNEHPFSGSGEFAVMEPLPSQVVAHPETDTAAFLAAIVEASSDAIISKNLEGIITSWNHAAERLLGYKPSEVLGRPISILIPQEHLDEEAYITDRIRRGERVEHFETVRCRKDGSHVTVSLTVSPIRNASGTIIGASKIARDTTEQRRAKIAAYEAGERYRSLFNAMDEGFCVVQMIFDEANRPQDYRFLEVNPAFEKQTGIQNGAGRSMREIAPTHEQYWFEIYGKVALTGEPIRFQNRAEALGRWYDVYAYRVDRPAERKVAILFTDISSRKETELTLAKAKQTLEDHARNLESQVSERTARLQRTIADLESFSYTVSHDLRSPLRAIEGFSQALLADYSDKLDKHGRDYLERIAKSAVRLDKLILEVLTYSEIGRDDVPFVRVNLDKLIDDVLDTYPAIRASAAEINVERPLPSVLGIHSSLTLCISHLLGNAVKFVPPASRAIVRVWTEKRDGTVRLFVEDNGIGIPQNLQARIFEPFQRAHPYAGYEGTGMGLTIVRKAVQRMNGTVGVESREGHGSKFWIELPAAP